MNVQTKRFEAAEHAEVVRQRATNPEATGFSGTAMAAAAVCAAVAAASTLVMTTSMS
jgi:hypothetical protein